MTVSKERSKGKVHFIESSGRHSGRLEVKGEKVQYKSDHLGLNYIVIRNSDLSFFPFFPYPIITDSFTVKRN